MKLYPLRAEHYKYDNKYGTVHLAGRSPKYHVANIYKPLLAIIDALGGCLFFFNKLKKQPAQPKKILVIRLDHLGDVVMTLPSYAALKQLYPHAEIHTLVRGFAEDLFYQNTNVDKVIPFDPPWFARDKKTSLCGTLKFLLNLRKQNYDLVIELHADPRNIIAAALIGGYRLGYGIRGFGFLLHKIVEFPVFNHMIESNIALIRALGYSGRTPLEALKLAYSSEDEQVINQYGYSGRKYVIINPGTGRQNKYWVAERWAQVADALISEGYLVILTGSAADIQECGKIQNVMNCKAAMLAGKTTLRQLLALVAHASLVLSPDTGIAHFAVSLGTPSITLFGPIPPALAGYEDAKHKCIVKILPCSYCAKAVCPRADKPNECMMLITAGEVIATAKGIL
ncbi:MAG: glycosyltransferase family 9 protein [Candidatus Aenigmarchaeota archaeon]|nr:glycosyltransferase family 9 protein [Candidatus Aenigmarchaeota archaeon]